MKEFIGKIMKAFSTEPGGYSARKLSAFWVVVLITLTHSWWFRYAFIKQDFNLMTEVLFMDFSFVSVALGMTTYEAVSRMKADKKKGEAKTEDEEKPKEA